MDVGAADVYLQPAHLLLAVQLPADLHIFLQGKARHIGHHGLVEVRLHLRQLISQHVINSRILQAHRIEHARRTLGNPRRWISKPGLQGGPLKGKGTQQIDII